MENITEAAIIRLFDSKYGNDISGRIIALEEEFNEFKEVVSEFEGSSFDEKGNLWLHLQDEAADLYSVALHIIHGVGLDHQEAIDMTWDKIKTRELNPQYKKEWH